MKKLIIAMIIIALSTTLNATEKKGLESLTPELRTLLSKEMIAVESGMKKIFSSMIAGKYEEVSTTAAQIKKSFILKQNLTKSQKMELKNKLPKEFLETDQGFHIDAGDLSEAAELEDVALMNFYVSKMTNTCIKCHSSFAKSRFPDFN